MKIKKLILFHAQIYYVIFLFTMRVMVILKLDIH